jgi:hypothetical protein
MYAALSNGYSASYARAIGTASQFDHIVGALAAIDVKRWIFVH